jgi:hypothetical protein
LQQLRTPPETAVFFLCFESAVWARQNWIMAYVIEFTATLNVSDPKIYINDCCWGGDVIRDGLLPVVSPEYEDVQTTQEDWGWFIWMRRGQQWSGVDIYCDDKESGAFRILISGWQRRWLRRKHVEGDDLEHIKEVTVNEISKWGKIIKVQRLSPDYRKEL